MMATYKITVTNKTKYDFKASDISVSNIGARDLPAGGSYSATEIFGGSPGGSARVKNPEKFFETNFKPTGTEYDAYLQSKK